jgi:hypothetical protein
LNKRINGARVIEGATAIVDIWMGGNRDWRSRLEQQEFLDSADWKMALRLAEAVLTSANSEFRHMGESQP